MLENVNVTSFEQNKHALMSSNAKVIFFQEHKVRKNERRKLSRKLRDKGW